MRTYKRTSGQTLIEFALVFPLVIFLLLGLFDLGRAVFFYATLNTAAREGTRYGIVLANATLHKEQLIETKVKEFLWVKELSDKCALTGSTCKIAVTYFYPTPPDPYSDDPYDPTVTVSITYEFEAITPGISLIIGNGGKIPLEATSTMLLAPFAKPIF